MPTYQVTTPHEQISFDNTNKKVDINPDQGASGSHDYSNEHFVKIRIVKNPLSDDYTVTITEGQTEPTAYELKSKFVKTDSGNTVISIHETAQVSDGETIALIIGTDDERLAKTSARGRGYFNLEHADSPVITSDDEGIIVFSKE